MKDDEILRDLVQDMLSKSHDPFLDTMSEAQILNAIKYYQGQKCAAELVAHPDAFFAVAAKQFGTQ